MTPELPEVLWPVSCFGYGIDVLRLAVAVCDCRGLGWEVACISQIISKKRSPGQIADPWQRGRFCRVIAHPPDRAALLLSFQEMQGWCSNTSIPYSNKGDGLVVSEKLLHSQKKLGL